MIGYHSFSHPHFSYAMKLAHDVIIKRIIYYIILKVNRYIEKNKKMFAYRTFDSTYISSKKIIFMS